MLHLNPEFDLSSLEPAERAYVEAQLAQLEQIHEKDPIQGFTPNCAPQAGFMASKKKVQAGFAGNQSGKSTALVVKSLIQVMPRELLPQRFQTVKRFDGKIMGRIVNPGTKQLKSTLIPTFRQWTPKSICKEESFDKSWNGQDQILTFSDGSFIDFLTYDQDLEKFGGPQRHFLGYDEPPPREIRDEGLVRLARYGGFEMFAMTPLKSNTGWIRREVWKKRGDPNVDVFKWSIHDNKALDKETVDFILAQLPNDLWRRAREFGDFVEVGGLIYPQFEEHVLKIPPEDAFHILHDRVKAADIVVGIDPGLRNAAFSFIAFDRDNKALVFDEVLLQGKYPKDYARAIRLTLAKWGIRESEVVFVIDPNYKVRGQANGENVESGLSREGIYCVIGENALEAGVLEVGQRLSFGMLEISPTCMGHRDNADEYAMEDTEDGEFKEKRNDSSHLLDGLRYGCMYRTFDPASEQQVANPLVWVPGEMPHQNYLRPRIEDSYMGSMS